VRPLWFLTFKLFVNSLRRAFGNPTRAILTLVMIGFILLAIGGNLISILFEPPKTPPTPVQPLMLPTHALTGLMMIMHLALILMAFTPTNARANIGFFVEADVNYLFPTPLDRFKVFRFLLLARGLFGSFFLMLLISFYYVVFGRASIRQLSTFMEPQVGAWGLLSYPLIYGTMSVALIMGSVRLGLHAYHHPRVWSRCWIVMISVLLLITGILGWYGYRAAESGGLFWQGVYQGLSNPLIYALLLPVRAPADAGVIVYNGWTPALFAGWFFWLGLAIMMHASLRRQAGWLYEFAGAMAQKRSRMQSAQRNPMEVVYQQAAERAQQGKLRAKRIRLFERWVPTGAWALLWRDLLLGFRLNGTGSWIFQVLILFGAVSALVAVKLFAGEKAGRVVVPVVGMVQYIVAILFIIGSLYGLMDLLKRMDFQKPLPLPAFKVVLIETLPAILFLGLMLFVIMLTALATFPDKASLWLYLFVVEITFMFPMSLGLLVLVMMNPDQTDYTQRLLLGFLMFPIVIIAGLPGGVLVLICFLAKVPLWLNAMLVISANAAMTAVMASVAASKYEAFNPTD
jgi:hypothetical protein